MTFVHIPFSSCFLSNTATFFSAFLAPILIIILFNLVIFVIVISVLIKHTRKKLANKGQADRETVIRTLISIIGVTALYGLSWLFGAFTIQGASEAFQILFTIFTSLQGFFIFLFFCVFGREARELWLKVLCCGKKIPGTTQSTQPTVRRQIPTTLQRPSQPSTMTSRLRSDPSTSNLNMASLSSSTCLRSSVFSESEATHEVSTVEANPTALRLEALEEESQLDESQSAPQSNILSETENMATVQANPMAFCHEKLEKENVPHQVVENADKLKEENKIDESQFALQSSTFRESEEMSTVEANLMALRLEALEKGSQIDESQSKKRGSSFSCSSAEDLGTIIDEQHQHDYRSSQPTPEMSNHSALHLPVLVRRSSTIRHHIETAQLRFSGDEDDSDSEVVANPNAEV